MLLPNLGRLSLTPTGGKLAPGQSPEDVNCVICLASLAAPPPDGENVWPFDDDQPIWIVACNNQHAFHKGCLRAYARDSENPSRCPECFVPIRPQVLTQVSRPSTGEHAAREEKEAEARAAGQRRDAAREVLREREILRQAQRELHNEDRRMYAMDMDEGEGEMEEEDWEELEARAARAAARPAARAARPSVRMPDWSEIAPRLRSYSARDDIETAMMLTRMMHGASGADRSARAYYNLTGVIGACIDRGSIASGRDEYRASMINTISAGWLEPWFYDTIVVCSDRVCPPAVKGQLLRLLAAYVDVPRVRVLLREMDGQTGMGRVGGESLGTFGEAVRKYIDHLAWLDPPTNASYTDEATFERNTNDARWIDALRVLHHLKWDPLVRDEWLLPYNGRSLVNDELGLPGREALERERFVPDARELVDDLVGELGMMLGTYDASTESLVYEGVKANLRALLRIFRVWHGRYSGFDEYEALSSEDPVIPFPFGKEVVRLWGLANHMHGVWERQHVEEPTQGRIEIEKLERYDQMREMLTRLVWLGVTWWVGRPYPANNDSATPDEMQHFFWFYVAPQYETEDDGRDDVFVYANLADLTSVINRNNVMRDQWIGDRRTGPWFSNLGMDNAEREKERVERGARRARAGGDFEAQRARPRTRAAARAGGDFEAPRARDGGETPNPRRQRRG